MIFFWMRGESLFEWRDRHSRARTTRPTKWTWENSLVLACFVLILAHFVYKAVVHEQAVRRESELHRLGVDRPESDPNQH